MEALIFSHEIVTQIAPLPVYVAPPNEAIQDGDMDVLNWYFVENKSTLESPFGPHNRRVPDKSVGRCLFLLKALN